MADYTTLKAAIASVIKTNGNQEITGLLLQQTLHSMLDGVNTTKQDTINFVINTANKFLRDDGSFQEILSPAGGFANNLYFTNVDSAVVTGYKTLSYTPDATAININASVAASEGNKVVQTYIYPSGVSVDLFPSGLWSFNFYGNIDLTVGVTQIGVQYFKRSTAGVETNLFTAWSEEVNNTTPRWIQFEATNPSFVVDPTDRMGARILIKTTSVPAVNMTIVIGDGYAAYLNNPNRIRHNQLRDWNGDTNYLHITQTEKTNFQAGYDDRFKWNGGSSGLVAATGRESLGLRIGIDVLAYRTFGTAANNNTGDFLAYNGTAVDSSKLGGQLPSYYQTAITGAASSITSSNLTANRALISNASGKVDISVTTSTELSYLNGVSSAIQTQLNGKAATNQTFYIGTTQVAINRASALLSLTGVSIDGNSGTATKLATARNIWGQSFDGSADISGALSNATTGSFSGNVSALTFTENGALLSGKYAAIAGNVTLPFAASTLNLGGTTIGKTNADFLIQLASMFEYESGTDSIKALKNFYSTSGVSAYGIGTGGGGGGGVDIIDDLLSTRIDAALSANQGRILKGYIDLKQPQLNGTGLVRMSGTTVNYDNNSYALVSSLSNYSQTSHNHSGTYIPVGGLGLLSDTLSALNSSVASTNFRTSIFGTSTSGWQIKSWRWDDVPPLLSGKMGLYGTAIVWAGSDTHGFLGLDYYTANAVIGGGHADQINWTATLLHSGNYTTYTDSRYYTETEIGNYFSGTTAISGYEKSHWDTAYGWGNHAGLYLPLSGGTISAGIPTLSLLSTQAGSNKYTFYGAYNTVDDLVLRNDTTSQRIIRVTPNSEVYFDKQIYTLGNAVIHSGNISSQSVASSTVSTLATRLQLNAFNEDNLAGQTTLWYNWSQYETTYGGGYLYGLYIDSADGNYATELLAQAFNEGLRFRNKNAGVWGQWRDIIHSGNIGSQSVNYAASAGTSVLLDGYGIGAFLRKGNINTDYWNQGNTWVADWHGTLPDGLSGVYNFGTGIIVNGSTASLQLYAPEQSDGRSGDLWYRTGWQATKRAWVKVWHSGNLTNALSNGYLPYWNGSSLGDTILWFGSSNVYIGSKRADDAIGLISQNYSMGYTYSTKFITLQSATEQYGITNDYGVGTGAQLSIVANQTFGNIGFYTGGAKGDKNERMRILPNGNVGIGYTDRTEKLAVNGTGYFNDDLKVGISKRIGWEYGDGQMYNWISNSYTNTGGIEYKSGSWTANQNIVAHNFETWAGTDWSTAFKIYQDQTAYFSKSVYVVNGILSLSRGSGEAYSSKISTEYTYPYIDTFIDSIAGASYQGRIIFRTSSEGGALSNKLILTNDGEGIFSGAVIAPFFNTGGYRPVTIGSGYVNMKSDTGGYAMRYGFIGSSGTDRGGFGAYGNADGLEYYFIGASYSNYIVRYDYSNKMSVFMGGALLNGPLSLYQGSANSGYVIHAKQATSQYFWIEGNGSYEAMLRTSNSNASWYVGLRTVAPLSDYQFYNDAVGLTVASLSTAGRFSVRDSVESPVYDFKDRYYRLGYAETNWLYIVNYNAGNALNLKVGGLLVSGSYADYTNVPSSGIWAAGGIESASYLKGTSVKMGLWEVVPSTGGTELELKYNNALKAKLDSSGNILAVGGVTAFAV